MDRAQIRPNFQANCALAYVVRRQHREMMQAPADTILPKSQECASQRSPSHRPTQHRHRRAAAYGRPKRPQLASNKNEMRLG